MGKTAIMNSSRGGRELLRFSQKWEMTKFRQNARMAVCLVSEGDSIRLGVFYEFRHLKFKFSSSIS
jgi:hypothetical protein